MDADTRPSPYLSSDYLTMFLTLFDATSDAVYVTRLDDSTLLDVNDSWTSLFGYDRDDVVGRQATDLGIWVRPEERDPFVRELREKRRVVGYPVRVRSASGRQFDVTISASLALWRGTDVMLGIVLPAEAAPVAEPREPATLLTELTPEEREVVEMVGWARTDAEIGAALGTSEVAVTSKLSRILSKLGLRYRSQVVLYLARRGPEGGES